MTNPTTHGQVPAAKRFTKKPVTIEAIQWTGKNLREVITFTDGPPDTRSHHAGMAWEAYTDLVARDGLMIYTLEDGPDRRAKHFADIGDWIIRGVKGEYYPCKPDIFEATYSPEAALCAQQPSPSGEESKETNMALSDEQIDATALKCSNKNWVESGSRFNHDFARAIEVEVRKQDDALIMQLAEALERARTIILGERQRLTAEDVLADLAKSKVRAKNTSRGLVVVMQNL